MKLITTISLSGIRISTLRVLTLVALCTCAPTLSARERSVEEMEQIAKAAIPMAAQARARVKGYEQKVEKLYELPALCVMGYAEGGFAVIARDDKYRAVWGYSDAPFDAEDVSPEFEWLMQEFDQAMQTNAVSEAMLKAAGDDATTSQPVVGPLIKTKWGQRDPFNRHCPKVMSEEGEVNCVAGCIPTALAQLVYFYGTPNRGMGHGSYFLNQKSHDVDLREWSWDFDKMLYEYTTTDGKDNFSAEQADEVARLMYACGVASRAFYGKSATSGATILSRAFGYEFAYTNDKAMIIELLDRGIPLRVEARASAGEFEGLRHCFLFDGYDDTGFIHCNFGWYGKQDGFYAITDLNNFNENVGTWYISETGNQLIQGLDNVWYYLKDNIKEAWVSTDNNKCPRTYGTDYVVIPSYIYQDGEKYEVTKVESGVFNYSDNSFITLPETLKEFVWFGGNNYKVEAIYCQGLLPPILKNCPPISSKEIKVYVLPEALKEYKREYSLWKFIKVLPLNDETSINSVLQDTNHLPISYDLLGRPATASGHSGISITNGRKEIRR